MALRAPLPDMPPALRGRLVADAVAVTRPPASTMTSGRPVPEEDDIIVRERLRTRRSVVLLADVSGSMRGYRDIAPALA